MKKEVIVSAKTIEQAVELGAAELKMKKDDVTYSVIELPKKGFLGLGSNDAKVKVVGEMSARDIAVGFLEKIIAHMSMNAIPKVTGETETEIKIEIIGENLGTLIGYHGEILDSLQYLTYLAVNKDDEEADADSADGEAAADKSDKTDKADKTDKTDKTDKAEKSGAIKISIDIENYRKKREETLQALAKKMADRVLKYGRSVTLEPMNPYERRIIHSAIQDMNGVSTHSVGQDNDRKIVITKDMPAGARQGFNNTRRPRPPYNSGFNRNNAYNANRPPSFGNSRNIRNNANKPKDE